MKELKAYVDGSFNVDAGRYGFGCVLMAPDGTICEYCGSNCNEESAKLRNVTGEMLGSMFAVKWAMYRGYDAVNICYDYTGIEYWATGAWRSKTELTKKYASSMQEWMKRIKITFTKIAAHTGDTYNEAADKLAKKAIEEELPIPDFRT